MNSVFLFINSHLIEIFGTISGIAYIFLSVRQIIWLWPLGIVTSALYIYVYYESMFYADMSLQVYYLVISIYGWYYWSRGFDNEKEEVPVIKLNTKISVVLLIFTIVCFVLIMFVLKKFTDSPLPGWDAFTTSLSITATWMLTKKYIEHWLIWIVVDAISLGLYLYRELYPTVVLFLVYTVLAVVGYYQWKSNLKPAITGD